MKSLTRFLGVSLAVLGLAPGLADGAAFPAADPSAFVNRPPRDDEDSVDGVDPPQDDGITDPVDDGSGDDGSGDDSSGSGGGPGL